MTNKTEKIINDLLWIDSTIEENIIDFEHKYKCSILYDNDRIPNFSDYTCVCDIDFNNGYLLYVEIYSGQMVRLEWTYKDYTHATNYPAILDEDGEYWYFMGKLHRRNGPAIIKNNGVKEWWENGVNVTKKYKRLEKIDKLLNN